MTSLLFFTAVVVFRSAQYSYSDRLLDLIFLLACLVETLDVEVACRLVLLVMARNFVIANLVSGCTSQSGILTDCRSSTSSFIMNIQLLLIART